MENVHVASDNCCSFNFVLKCLPNKGHYDLSSYKFDPHVWFYLFSLDVNLDDMFAILLLFHYEKMKNCDK